MTNLIRQERYVFQTATEEQMLRVEELVFGDEEWPERCRVDIPKTRTHAAKRFYGPTPQVAAERAAEYLSGSAGPKIRS